MKTAAAGAAGIPLSGAAAESVFAAQKQQGIVWTDKMPINPDISNMRVICYHDEKICPTSPNPDLFDRVNEAVDTERVSAVLDEMAVQLTEKTSAAEAWKTIFRSSKPWADTKVMIKVNAVEKRMLARVAVIKKITDVLTGYGVQPKNIVLFDGQGPGWATYQNWVSLTDTTKIAGVLSNNYNSLGGKATVKIPEISDSNGPADLVNGVTDIIVNIAVNKGHDSNFNIGKATLCLKNHFGTFLQNNGMAMHLHSTKGLINSNKIAEIAGGNPVRQQLCIIDSIWAIKQNMNGTASHKPDRLVMGTFAGAVDYYCAKEIREKLMNVTNHEQNVITQFLTAFGYAESDPEYVELTPTGITSGKINPPVESAPFSFSLNHPALRSSTLHFSLPSRTSGQVRAEIFDLRGSRIRELSADAATGRMVWNGRAENGGFAGAGNYVVTITAGRHRSSARMTVMR